ncbi:hypothetical protein C9I92_24825 [Photobacterium ganghwense]|uniref:Uncharacterized protein n=1 Tax=Photobacterium ganghwense TaxID=320778 RepID=A0A0J1H6I7_9GAMM|nr:hypothetical protein [Photobacterium ganghwense]KLV07330.1 hypothetical protein ABT57_17860 [Photobacterium ganghwense]PSU03743.1 hypothetical protein C9I92_24825 [Photobacterium ganghwense]
MLIKLDTISTNPKQLVTKAKRLDGSGVSLNELMPPRFIQMHSKFASLDILMEASGFNVKTPADFKAIPAREWNQFIALNTNFESWQDMLSEAGRLYIHKQLFT